MRSFLIGWLVDFGAMSALMILLDVRPKTVISIYLVGALFGYLRGRGDRPRNWLVRL